jgi:hypothetical protein
MFREVGVSMNRDLGPNQIFILGHGERDVCDGGHWLDVIKKVDSRAQAKLGLIGLRAKTRYEPVVLI